MEPIRKPWQGVTNIIRFNWHFYVLSALLLVVIVGSALFFGKAYTAALLLLCALMVSVIGISLLVSWYIYDLSGLYGMQWLTDIPVNTRGSIANIHAGFDETSHLLHTKYPNAKLTVLDFYDPTLHTEVSIKRARKAYPPYPGTIAISTTRALPFADNELDTIFLIFAAHEIRDNNERITFFQELHRVLSPGGRIVITEHLRNAPNFIAYNIGFLHFLPRHTWLATFSHAGFTVASENTFTPFITTFTLSKHGTTP